MQAIASLHREARRDPARSDELFARACALLPPQPLKIQIQTTTRCNAACAMCPYPLVTAEPGFEHAVMEDGRYRRILDDLRGQPIERLSLFLMNEPLLDRRLAPWIALARQALPRTTLGLFSNGAALDVARARALAAAGLDELCVSVHGFTAETYERVMAGLSYERMRRNLDDVLAIADAGELGAMRIQIVTGDVPEVAGTQALAPLRYRDRTLVKAFSNERSAVGVAADLPSTVTAAAESGPCQRLFVKLYILATGEAVLCNVDWRRTVVLGRVGDPEGASIGEVWRGERYTEIPARALHRPLCPGADLCALRLRDRGGPRMTPLRGQTVLVTGAGGFIGSVVVRQLAGHDARVRAWLGPAPSPDLVGPPPGVAVAFGDIADRGVLDQQLAGAACVYHLAGPPSAVASFTAAAEYLRVHAVGTATLLERSIAAGVRRLVYVSSAEVYGPATGLVAEDDPVAPRSPYGMAKLAAEQCIASCAGAAGLQATIVRPFSIYGRGAPAGSLVASIVAAVTRGESPALADLRPVRDYCHVEDAADGIVRAGWREGTAVRSYNLASGRGRSVLEVARTILEAAGREDLEICERASDRPPAALTLALVGDPARARDELGFRAEITFEAGIRRLLRQREEG